MTKTVPMSVRLSHEDAEFIANLQIDDAVTPSDKIRCIVRAAKKQQERTISYEGHLNMARETLKNITQKIKASELESNKHSELVNTFNEWVAEAFAFVASCTIRLDEGAIGLETIEAGISERVFRLLETVARMGVTHKAPCYDKDVITKGFIPALEIIEVINQRIIKETNNG